MQASEQILGSSYRHYYPRFCLYESQIQRTSPRSPTIFKTKRMGHKSIAVGQHCHAAPKIYFRWLQMSGGLAPSKAPSRYVHWPLEAAMSWAGVQGDPTTPQDAVVTTPFAVAAPCVGTLPTGSPACAKYVPLSLTGSIWLQQTLLSNSEGGLVVAKGSLSYLQGSWSRNLSRRSGRSY